MSGMAESFPNQASGRPHANETEAQQKKPGDPKFYPLSFSQERLWFLDRFMPGSPAYHVPAAYRLASAVDASALRRALNGVIARHESLRTTFDMRDGRPVQLISPSLELDLPLFDLRPLPDHERNAEAQRLAAQEALRPFDLASGPLLRAALVQLADADFLLLLTMHHIVSDAWSMTVLLRELGLLYDAFASGRTAHLPDLPIQYADYAAWQRRHLSGENLARHLAYWRTRLAGAPPVLELPADRPRPPVQSLRGGLRQFEIAAGVAKRLRALAQAEGATMFMALLAAFKVLLMRLTGQPDVVVGTVMANRGRAELEGLIGFFVNTLVLRTRLESGETMRGALRQVREVVLGAYAHQELPFERLVEELQPERDLSRNPLFQVLFTMQSSPEATVEAEVAGLDMQVDTKTSKFDLLLLLAEKGEGLKGLCEYSTDLFDLATVDRMIGHYLHLLEEVAASPDRSIETLSLLTDAQTRQLLVEFNATGVVYPRETSAHQLFEAQVARTPDAPAVVSDDATFTYRELNARANQLAHRLRALGVGAEACVGLCVERSLDMIVGVLGILKAGGAYVPLDAAYPRERLSFMLEKAAVRVLLTRPGLTDALPNGGGARIVLLDDEELRGQPTDNPGAAVLPDNLAYVIYTSGSTGRPKGVAMRHGALANLLLWHLNHATLSRAARTLQFASLNFDVSFQEIFTTICSGGTLLLIPEEVRRDVRQLSRRLAEQNIERVFLPPVILQQLAEVLDDGETLPATLKQVVVAGERLVITPRVVALFDRLKGCVLHNHYGPTETHVVTEHVLSGEAGGWPAHPAIGRPISNQQAYILDHNFQPLPVGVPGELYLGGEALARGYVNAPELTAERFIPHPLASTPGSRLYKTGDLARYSPEGRIEFLGRLDHQLKLRGYRIEPGEIEAVMREYPQLKEALVLLREDTPGRARLVAYVVPGGEGDGHAFAAGELSAFLRERLPDYMIPSAFVVLKSLPLSPNGKVDTHALPAPDAEQLRPEAAFVEPRNSVEADMAQIWSEVLGVSRIGMHDNFFELGGHSLLATQVMSRVREVFGVELEVRRIFETPTVAGLALTIIDVMAVRTDAGLASELLAEIEHLTPEEARLLLSEEAG